MGSHGVDLSGQRFGHLEIGIPYKGKFKGREYERLYKFWCSHCHACGRDVVVSSAHLKKYKSHKPLSCGCLGHRWLPDVVEVVPPAQEWYTSTVALYDELIEQWERQEVDICFRWRRAYSVFIADMGKPLQTPFKVVRILDEFGYEPSNCKYVYKEAPLV